MHPHAAAAAHALGALRGPLGHEAGASGTDGLHLGLLLAYPSWSRRGRQGSARGLWPQTLRVQVRRGTAEICLACWPCGHSDLRIALQIALASRLKHGTPAGAIGAPCKLGWCPGSLAAPAAQLLVAHASVRVPCAPDHTQCAAVATAAAAAAVVKASPRSLRLSRCSMHWTPPPPNCAAQPPGGGCGECTVCRGLAAEQESLARRMGEAGGQGVWVLGSTAARRCSRARKELSRNNTGGSAV